MFTPVAQASTLGSNRIRISDTTLRGGEQSRGCRMTRGQKLRIAHALRELGADVIEAGFPAASHAAREAVGAIAREVQGPVICALAGCTSHDIEIACSALEGAARRRLHLLLQINLPHLPHELDLHREQLLRLAADSVRHARDLCDDVEFSPAGASPAEFEFLGELVQAVVAAGATTVNISDTTGCTLPEEISELFRYLRRVVVGVDNIELSVHCHNDLGMAVANSLSAVIAGARQIECTVNGIGERAGNCSLEQVVMALKTREAFFNVTTGIRTHRLQATSRLVSRVTGIPRHTVRHRGLEYSVGGTG